MSKENNSKDVSPLTNAFQTNLLKVHGIIDGKYCRIIIQGAYAETVLVYFTDDDFYKNHIDFIEDMETLPQIISKLCAANDKSVLKEHRTKILLIKAIIDELLNEIGSPLTLKNRLNAAKSLLPPSWITEYETWLRCEYVENCIDVHKSVNESIAESLREFTEEIYLLKRNPSITSGINEVLEWMHKLFASTKE